MDETDALIKFEMDGMVYFVKGGVEVAKLLKEFIKWSHNKAILSGIKSERSMKGIDELSKRQTDGKGQSVVINVLKEYAKEFIEDAEKRGLHYATLIDFDQTDDMIPFYIPAGEVSQYQAMNVVYQQRALNNKKDDIGQTEEQLKNAKKEFDAAPEGSVEKEKTAHRVALLEEKLDEQRQNADSKAKNMEKSGVIPLDAYFAQAKNSIWVKDPEKAFAELVKGADISKDFDKSEAFKSIRDPKNIPSEKCYIVPLKGEHSTIMRTFTTDADNICYSRFEAKAKDGTILTMTDDPAVKTDGKILFAKDQLDEFLNTAGIQSDKFRVDVDGASHLAYKKWHNNTPLASESKPEAQKLSPRLKQLVDTAQAKASAGGVEIVVGINTKDDSFVMADEKGDVVIKTKEGEIVLGKDVKPLKIDSSRGETKFLFNLKREDTFSFKKSNGETTKITANEIKSILMRNE